MRTNLATCSGDERFHYIITFLFDLLINTFWGLKSTFNEGLFQV